jgi:hypothetical protein
MTQDTLRHQVEADDGSLPERWNPEDLPGAMLVGTLLRFETIVTDFGPSQVAVIQDEDDGTVYGVALFRSVLKKRFDTLEPRAGDRIGLKYVGLAEPRTKGANPYHNYVLKVERNSSVAALAEAPEQLEELPF